VPPALKEVDARNYRKAIAEKRFVTVQIFDLKGKQVQALINGPVSVGYHAVKYDGSNCGPGLYICRMKAASFIGEIRLLKTR
jgi:hypothetical protein